MSKYIVWSNQGYDGWSKSDEFEDLPSVFKYLATENYSFEYLVTKTVDVVFVDRDGVSKML